MPWQCRFHEKQPENPQPGDIWPMPIEDPEIQTYYDKHVFSLEYLRDWKGKRPALMICLPGAGPHIIDQKWRGRDNGWTITGFPPRLTASPSIHILDKYHGWLQDGVLSDDLDGRQYAP